MTLTAAQNAFAIALADAVKRTLPSLKDSAVRLLVAHGALESGWGTCNAWKRGFNFGNITAGPAWKGAKWTDAGGDTEYDSAGKVKKIDQTWRAYSSVDDAVKDYWDFLGPVQNRGRYLHAREMLEKADAIDFCIELSKAGYYTLPVVEYAKRLGRVLEVLTPSSPPVTK